MSTQKEMEHERHRFSYMTVPQLRTRLGRMTKLNKLLAFAECALENDQTALSDAAIRKFIQLTGEGISLPAGISIELRRRFEAHYNAELSRSSRSRRAVGNTVSEESNREYSHEYAPAYRGSRRRTAAKARSRKANRKKESKKTPFRVVRV